MNKKIKSLIASVLVTGSIISCTGGVYAATRTITAQGKMDALLSINYVPEAYLYTYNSKGNYVKKYKLSVSHAFFNKYKLSLNKTKLDDKKVSKICLQLKTEQPNGDKRTKYSPKLKLKSGNYTITVNDDAIPSLKLN